MAKPDKVLVVLMRIMGGSMILAIIAAFMPDSWLHAAVAKVEPGVPVGPLVEYMARGWSVFYFMLGGLIWLFSTDLTRYLPAIRWVSWCYLLINGSFKLNISSENHSCYWVFLSKYICLNNVGMFK